MTPEQLSQIQQALITLGFFNGEADGIFGPVTRTAIRKYQEANGFPQSDYLSMEQRQALLKPAPVQRVEGSPSTVAPPPETPPQISPSQQPAPVQRPEEAVPVGKSPPSTAQQAPPQPPPPQQPAPAQRAEEASPPGPSTAQQTPPQSPPPQRPAPLQRAAKSTASGRAVTRAARWGVGQAENAAIVQRLKPALRGEEYQDSQRAVALHMATLTELVGESEARNIQRRWEGLVAYTFEHSGLLSKDWRPDKNMQMLGINTSWLDSFKPGIVPTAFYVLRKLIGVREEVEKTGDQASLREIRKSIEALRGLLGDDAADIVATRSLADVDKLSDALKQGGADTGDALASGPDTMGQVAHPFNWASYPIGTADRWAVGAKANDAIVRRLMPGVTGATLEKAKEQVERDMYMATALVGAAEADVSQDIWARHLNKMLTGEYKDPRLARWFTASDAEKYQAQVGPLTVTRMMELFTLKREQLEEKVTNDERNSKTFFENRDRLRILAEDARTFLGDGLSVAMLARGSKDFARLRGAISQSLKAK